MNPVSIVLNKKYPFNIPEQDGAISEMLRPAGNTLLIAFNGITDTEISALTTGEVKCGILNEHGAILMIWQFFSNNHPIVTIDSPFSAKLIPDIQMYDVLDAHQRLLIDIHVVDIKTKTTKGLRSITLTPNLTLNFLSAVQDQLSSPLSDSEQLLKWINHPVEELVTMATMEKLGT